MTSMSSNDINRIVRRELEQYPRGPRGSARNRFRAAYQMLRTHSLSRAARWPLTPQECAAQAAEIIGEN